MKNSFTKFETLRAALDFIVKTDLKESKPFDRVLFWLGRASLEDFSEILLLASNGHGIWRA
jgi:hypothetical protein